MYAQSVAKQILRKSIVAGKADREKVASGRGCVNNLDRHEVTGREINSVYRVRNDRASRGAGLYGRCNTCIGWRDMTSASPQGYNEIPGCRLIFTKIHVHT